MSNRQYSYKSWGSMNNENDLKLKTVNQTINESKQNTKKDIVTELKDINHLKFALKSNRFVVVKVGANWCQPCKALEPSYEKLAEKCDECGLFVFFTDDVDNSESCHASKVEAVPTFYLYTDGDLEPKKKFQGDYNGFELLINKILDRVTNDNSSDYKVEDEKVSQDQNIDKDYTEKELMGQSNYLNPSIVRLPKSKEKNEDTFQKTLNHYNQNDDLSKVINKDFESNFIPSNKFEGSKDGWVYKNDILGLGYYKDTK